MPYPVAADSAGPVAVGACLTSQRGAGHQGALDCWIEARPQKEKPRLKPGAGSSAVTRLVVVVETGGDTETLRPADGLLIAKPDDGPMTARSMPALPGRLTTSDVKPLA
jgi:hypothetical protein